MRLKQIGSAGNKTRRYHERPNETSNTEVKETMKVAITAKRVVILMMTMALAGAMVACSGAAGTPGPAGPPGEQGPSGTPAETPDPTDPTDPQPGDSPVKTITASRVLRFNNMANGDPDKMPQTVDVSTFFYPKTGLTYMVEVPAAAKKYFSANIPEDTSILTVEQMEADSTYMNYMFTVKAMSPNETFDKSTIYVRRNQPPMIVRMSGDDTPPDDPRGAIPIWVTGSEMDIKAMQVSARAAGADALSGMYIYTAIGAADNKMDAFFSDDAGNKLTFEPAPLTFSDAEKLSIIGATEKITLMGKKTTAYDTTPNDDDNTNDDDMAITVKLSATDDGGLALMDDPADVFMVKVDTPPMKKGGISLMVLKLGSDATEMRMVSGDLRSYFMEDRSPLDLTAWSSDSTVAVVYGNMDNSKTKLVMDADPADGTQLKIIAKGRGSATIMVKAMENPEDASDPPTPAELFMMGAGKEQSVEQTIMVEVN